MAPRREILDSEDDASDFGGGSEIGDGAAGAESEWPLLRDEVGQADQLDQVAGVDEAVGASHLAGTDSTDPSFFQRIYEQQQAAVDMQQDPIPDTAPVGPSASTWTDISSAPPPGQKQPQTKDYSSLTPVTDPVPASRRSKRTREVPQTEVVDLTDISPPRKDAASAASDVWDVPSSARSQRASRTYGKRKMAPLSLEQGPTPSAMPDTQDPYAFPDATPPAKNRAGRATPSSPAHQPPESSPVMLVPTEESTSSDRRARSSRKQKASFGVESSMPDTAAPSLYVTQSTLTASQKQEYRMVSLSSEAGEVSEMLPPDPPIGAEMYKSSCATTIAYPTPSRVTSSRRLAEVAKELDGSGFETSPVQGVYHLQSSPDVLTEMPATASPRGKRSRRKAVSSSGLDSSELEPPSSTRRAKKRRVVREAADESWELDPLGGMQESNDGQQQNIHDEDNVGGEGDVTEQQEAGANAQAPVPKAEPTGPPTSTSKPTAKGKRGRKKKGSKPEKLAPNPTEQTTTLQETEADPEPAAAAPMDQTPEAPAKRKRGRPRKSEPARLQPGLEPIDEAEPEAEQQHAEANPETETHTTPPPLSTIHPNSQPNLGADAMANNDMDNGVNTGKENVKQKEKDNEKEKQPALALKDVKTVSGGGAAKVQYRVGLSKRSRIAPLLKSLKKPV